jgi:aminopeptidase N/puromycin-sensitive aminopeptidase
MKNHCLAPLMRTFLSALAAFLFLFPVTASAERLPQTVRPEHYTLTLTPDLKAATFTGIETIDVILAEPTNRITLNAVALDLKSVTVTAGGKEQQATITLDKEKELATSPSPSRTS